MKKFAAIIIALVLTLSLAGCGGKSKNAHNDTEVDTGDISMSELMDQMVIGWNLGNTLDAPEGETSWFQPKTKKEMIDKIHELGFNTVRIPVSWGLHTSGSPDYTIDEDWFDRVEEVVNYALDNDMFVILNSHHDNDFYYPSKKHEEKSVNYIEKIWTQVAERFKDYDQHLIFQGMNEPRLSGTNYEWWVDYNNQDCVDAVEIISEMNQKFVDVVRASGGRNADRFLMCSGYCGSPEYTLREPFVLPTDTVEGKLIVSVHAYTPYDLAMDGESAVREFTAAGAQAIDDFMEKHYNVHVKNGVGIIIDEMGVINKSNSYARKAWATYFVAKAKSLGMVCCVWDNGNTAEETESYGLFDREKLEIYESAIPVYEGLMAGLETTPEEAYPE